MRLKRRAGLRDRRRDFGRYDAQPGGFLLSFGSLVRGLLEQLVLRVTRSKRGVGGCAGRRSSVKRPRHLHNGGLKVVRTRARANQLRRERVHLSERLLALERGRNVNNVLCVRHFTFNQSTGSGRRFALDTARSNQVTDTPAL